MSGDYGQVGEAFEADRQRALRCGQRNQQGAAAAVAVRAPSPAEHAFAQRAEP
jgi:hypothetical protein